MNFSRRAVFAAALLACGVATAQAAPLTKIRISDNGDYLVPLLGDALGFFKQEGIELVRMKVTDVMPEDFELQEPLIEGKIDAAYHWMQHTVYGARHGLPVKAVVMLADAPFAKVMVATTKKDQIKSAADFRGKNVAQGMGYATKSMLTNYLALKAGVPQDSYKSVFPEVAGRQEAVINGLKVGTVDVATFLEPLSSTILSTGLVTTLYDMTSRESTTKVLGAPYPSVAVLMAPKYIAAHPDTVQKLVNGFVRTMRYMNTHSAEDIASHLPPEYFEGKPREEGVAFVRNTLSNYAKGDYTFSPEGVKLVVDTVNKSKFDTSPEGLWRKAVKQPTYSLDSLYTNQFAKKAMATIK